MIATVLLLGVGAVIVYQIVRRSSQGPKETSSLFDALIAPFAALMGG